MHTRDVSTTLVLERVTRNPNVPSHIQSWGVATHKRAPLVALNTIKTTVFYLLNGGVHLKTFNLDMAFKGYTKIDTVRHYPQTLENSNY